MGRTIVGTDERDVIIQSQLSSNARLVIRTLGGDDLMAGGSGGDRFVFTKTRDSTPDAADHVLDFRRTAGDQIAVSALSALL